MIPAIHSWSFRKRFQEDENFDIFQAIDITAEMGYGAIEIMAGKANGGAGDFASDDVPYLKSVIDYAEKAGIQLACFSTYNDFAFVKDEEWRLANIAYIKHWLELAGELGVPNIRMLTGYYVEGEDRERLEQLTYEGICECVPVAEKHGVNMAIENHNSIFFQAEDIVNLIKKIGSDRLTACPDPSNGVKGFLTNECTEAEAERVFETAKIMAPYATESHIKFKGFDRTGKMLGFGKNLKRLFEIYLEAGYDGVVAVESVCDGDLIEPLDPLCDVLKKAMKRAKKNK
ncbi:MAG: sugar phosphate isomerase/epimerase family protein [Candidatus Sumerlaeia bacterium]